MARPFVLPSAYCNGVGAPNNLITRLDSPAHACPCQRFADVLASASA